MATQKNYYTHDTVISLSIDLRHSEIAIEA